MRSARILPNFWRLYAYTLNIRFERFVFVCTGVCNSLSIRSWIFLNFLWLQKQTRNARKIHSKSGEIYWPSNLEKSKFSYKQTRHMVRYLTSGTRRKEKKKTPNYDISYHQFVNFNRSCILRTTLHLLHMAHLFAKLSRLVFRMGIGHVCRIKLNGSHIMWLE